MYDYYLVTLIFSPHATRKINMLFTVFVWLLSFSLTLPVTWALYALSYLKTLMNFGSVSHGSNMIGNVGKL